MKIAVLASGGGTNLQAIIDSIENKYLKFSKIELVLSNNKNAYALERAEKNGLQTLYLNPKDFNSRDEYDQKIVEILKEKNIDLIVLAGYLRWISKYFVDSFKNKIINIHPSLLPSFKGLHAIEQAYEYGVKISGVTVHFVDETEDGGTIIAQEKIRIEDGESLESFEEKIHKIEHKLYPEVISLIEKNSISIKGRKANIKE